MQAPQDTRTDVPRIFQLLVVLYVILTGEIPEALQAALFGLTGGGQEAFSAAFISSVAVDMARLAPLFILARHPLGILHPLIITILIWPLLLSVPSVVQEFGGVGGLFLGLPVSPPYYRGLSWLLIEDIWWATAAYNMLQFLALISIYAGFSLSHGKPAQAPAAQGRVFNTIDLRRLLVILIGLNIAILLAFITLRGGLESHLADLSRGRFRSLAGLGPLIAIFDIGVLALIIWIAARPEDVRTPLFLLCVAAVAASQFISNGSRSGTLTVFMIVGLSWSLRTRRIPWRLAVIMAPLIFMLLGFLAVVRTSGLSNQSATEALARADTSRVLMQVQEEIKIRQSLSGAIPVIADGFRVTGGPLLGESYLAAIFAAVPRSIWEEKPRGPGSLYAQHFLGEVREGTAVPIGPIAEAYWNFGILGVIILHLFYGFLLRIAHDLYVKDQRNPFVVCLFIIFATRFHVSTDSLVPFQQHILLFIIIYLLARLTARSAAPVYPQAATARAGELPLHNQR